MIPPETPIIEYTFTKGGVVVRSQKFLQAGEGYEYKSSRVLNEDKIKAKITDYAVIGPDGEDLTQATFHGPRLLIVMFDVRKASTDDITSIKKLVTDLEGTVPALVLTSSSSDQMELFRHEHQLAVPYAFSDATVLKTIIRSNPGITLWKDGTVLGNWHHHDTPDAAKVLELLLPK